MAGAEAGGGVAVLGAGAGAVGAGAVGAGAAAGGKRFKPTEPLAETEPPLAGAGATGAGCAGALGAVGAGCGPGAPIGVAFDGGLSGLMWNSTRRFF